MMMKKIIISAVAAGAILSQLSAVEVYKDGDKSVSIFGTIRGAIGFGGSFETNFNRIDENNTTYKRSSINDILFGVQGNSRIGVKFKLGGFFGNAIIGANEKTLLSSASGTPGFRNLSVGYDFGPGAGKLLVGKEDTLTSMSGYSSDIFDNDSGLNGFGGHATSVRRFQITYDYAFNPENSVKASISENDFTNDATAAIKDSAKSARKSIPRVSVSYEHKSKGLTAKAAVSYAYSPGKQAVIVNAGVKPKIGENGWISAIFSYGLNGSSIGEQTVAGAKVSHGYNNLGLTGGTTGWAALSDVNIAAISAEYGHKVLPSLSVVVGAGYQYASSFRGTASSATGSQYSKLHAYAVFVQTPWTINQYISIIPQVGYRGTTNTSAPTVHNTGAIVALAQIRATF